MSDLMSAPRTILDRANAGAGLTVAIAERGPVGMIALRGDLSSPALQAAVTECTGVPVPAPLAARFASGLNGPDGNGEERRGAVWMSPDELLLFCGYAEAGARLARLSEALEGEHHMAVDLSDARALIGVAGPGARELMAKGAPVDVSDAAFPPGTARRTHMAEIAVGLWRIGDEDWEIVCLQSFAGHLFDWLVASSGEAAQVGYF